LSCASKTRAGQLHEISPKAAEVLWIDQAPGSDIYDESWGAAEWPTKSWREGRASGPMSPGPLGEIAAQGFVPGSNQPAPAPILRHGFTLPRRPRRASLRSSGLGCHEIHCNGAKVGTAVLDPAMTQYDKTVLSR
jgi:alpha-L-rhamnosidase